MTTIATKITLATFYKVEVARAYAAVSLKRPVVRRIPPRIVGGSRPIWAVQQIVPL